MESNTKDLVVFLGRTITWTEDGYTWEPDEKHAQVLIRTLGLEQCKPSATPYCQECKDMLQQDDHELSELEICTHRGHVARVVYLAQDRMDLSVSVCLLASSMANPRGSDQARLKRVGRYLQGRPLYRQLYRWQSETTQITLQTDSDWATCRNTRRSKSGGIIFVGVHPVSHWCWLQTQAALSSLEAELYSSVHGLKELAGFINVLRERFGEYWCSIQHEVDATTCQGIMLRRGAGGIKYLQVKDLCVQEAVRQHNINVVKIPREQNVADALASPSTPTDLEVKLTTVGVTWPSTVQDR